jgi:hypothetical protein
MVIWNPWALTAMAATLLAWSLALLVVRVAPDRRIGGRLALLLMVEGIDVSLAWQSTILNAPAALRVASLVHYMADFALLGLYLPFLALALDAPLLRPFRHKRVELLLRLMSAAGALAVVLWPGWFVREVVASPQTEFFRWIAVPGSGAAVVLLSLAIMFVVGLAAAISSFRRSRTTLARERSRAFVLAFGTRDFVWAFIYVSAAAGWAITPTAIAVSTQLYAASLILYVLFMTYGILTTQLFDIHLRLKWTLRRGTLAAMFVAVFFFVSESVTNLLSQRLGTLLGIFIASLLMFFLTPLQRFAERVSNAAMPNVQPTSEYTAFRKLQVYHAALEGAYKDGEITSKERTMLVHLQQTLGITEADAERLEADFTPAQQVAQSTVVHE